MPHNGRIHPAFVLPSKRKIIAKATKFALRTTFAIRKLPARVFHSAVMASTDASVDRDAPTGPPKPSIGELKELLTRHGIDHSKCLYRADLEALAKGLPADAPQAPSSGTPAEAAPPRGKPRKGGSGTPSIESIAALDGPPLFAALRGISDESERRRVTAKVHAVKMALWRLKPTFRGMAQHLTEDVHPMFRNAFQQVLRASEKRGSVVVSSFESSNRSLHGHHGTEDRSWFPVLRRQHPELRGDLDILEADHRALVALEGRITKDKDVEALAEFVALLDDHLNREEMMTLPALMDGTGGW